MIISKTLGAAARDTAPKAGEKQELLFEFDGADRVTLRPVAGRSSLEERDGVISIDHRSGDYLVTSEGLSGEITEGAPGSRTRPIAGRDADDSRARGNR